MVNKQNSSFSPLRITAIYVVIALLWLVFSDDILRFLISAPQVLDDVIAYKEWIFAGLIVPVIFYLSRYYRQKIKWNTTFIEKVFENLSVGVAVSTFDEGNDILINKKFKEIYGWSEQEIPDQESFFKNVFSDEYNYIDFQKFRERLYQGVPKKIEWPRGEIIKKGGSKKVLTGATIPLKKQNLIISTVVDVTKQVELQSKLKSKKKKFERAQREAKIGYWENNLKNDNPPEWSKNLYNIFGLDPESYSPTNESFLEMVYADDHESLKEMENKILETGSVEDSFRFIKPNGEVGFYYSRNELICNDEGESLKIIGIIQDISDLRNAELKLQEERKRFKLVAETTSDIIWDMDLENEILWRSEEFEKLFGYNHSDKRHNFNNWAAYIHPDDRDHIKKSFDHFVKKEEGKWEEKYRIQKKDGSIAYVIDRGAVVSKKDGEAVRILGTINDVTERRRAEIQLEESERKYRHFFSNSPEPMFIYDPYTLEFVEVNQAAVDHYGYSNEEFMDMTLADIRPPKDVEAMKENVRKNRGEDSHSEKWQHLKKDGTKITVNMSASDVLYGNYNYRLVLINDITKEQRIQEKMIQSVIEGENNERKRIAHELHDGLGQYLVAANMNFESVKNELNKMEDKRQKQFKVGLSLLQNALSETRSIAYNLMPKAIADFGLATALENMVQDFEKSTDINFKFDHNCENIRLNNHAEINIFRIFQELTSNAVRHAQCSKIIMELQIKDDTLTISVGDNGIGADSEQMNGESGLGMKSIRMRVNNLSGSINIASQSGDGMKTDIQIPNIQRLKRNGAKNE